MTIEELMTCGAVLGNLIHIQGTAFWFRDFLTDCLDGHGLDGPGQEFLGKRRGNYNRNGREGTE